MSYKKKMKSFLENYLSFSSRWGFRSNSSSSTAPSSTQHRKPNGVQQVIDVDDEDDDRSSLHSVEIIDDDADNSRFNLNECSCKSSSRVSSFSKKLSSQAASSNRKPTVNNNNIPSPQGKVTIHLSHRKQKDPTNVVVRYSKPTSPSNNKRSYERIAKTVYLGGKQIRLHNQHSPAQAIMMESQPTSSLTSSSSSSLSRHPTSYVGGHGDKKKYARLPIHHTNHPPHSRHDKSSDSNPKQPQSNVKQPSNCFKQPLINSKQPTANSKPASHNTKATARNTRPGNHRTKLENHNSKTENLNSNLLNNNYKEENDHSKRPSVSPKTPSTNKDVRPVFEIDLTSTTSLSSHVMTLPIIPLPPTLSGPGEGREGGFGKVRSVRRSRLKGEEEEDGGGAVRHVYGGALPQVRPATRLQTRNRTYQRRLLGAQQSVFPDQMLLYKDLMKSVQDKSSPQIGSADTQIVTDAGGSSTPKALPWHSRPIPVIDLEHERKTGVDERRKNGKSKGGEEGGDILDITEWKKESPSICKKMEEKRKQFQLDLARRVSKLSLEHGREDELREEREERMKVSGEEMRKMIMRGERRERKQIVPLYLPEEGDFVEDEEEEEVLPELTEKQLIEIEGYVSPRAPGHQVLVEAHDIPIKRDDIRKLTNLSWLNDELINFYLSMVVKRNEGGQQSSLPTVYTFNTFFYPKLSTSGYQVVRRWTRRVDVFSYDILLVPIHLHIHWCMAVVDFRTRTIDYFDSLLQDNNDCLKLLKNYLVLERKDKKQELFDTTSWVVRNRKDIPAQKNGSDCGMFALKFAEYSSRDAPITFTQEDIPYFRKRMMWEIVNNTLISP